MTCDFFLDSLTNFLKIVGNASLSQRDGRPGGRHVYSERKVETGTERHIDTYRLSERVRE